MAEEGVRRLGLEFHSSINRKSIGALLNYFEGLPSGESDLLLLIGSGGGDNQWARSAYSALVNLPKRIHLTTCGCGTVDSSAVTLFCAGGRRLCLPHTRFQLHQARWTVNERVDLRRAREIADILESDDRSHAVAISAAIARPVEDVLAWIQQGTVWMPDQARIHGLVHDITDSVPRLLDGREVTRIFNLEA